MSVINTNITSLIGQHNLTKSQNALQTSMERLSSGLRINSAKDDAAGQAIANRMTAQITGLAQAQRNANDGISVAQTAEGALNQVNDNLQRIRELTVQAQNDTNSSNDLQSIQDEINQRLDEIDRISRETNFNGVEVLAQDRALNIQVGANDTQVIEVELQEINRDTLQLEGFTVAGDPAATVSDVERLLGQEITGRSFDVGGIVYNIDDEGAVTAGGNAVFVDAVTGELTPTEGGGTQDNDEIVISNFGTTAVGTDPGDVNAYFDAFGFNQGDIEAIDPNGNRDFTETIDGVEYTLNVSVDNNGDVDSLTLTETDGGASATLNTNGNDLTRFSVDLAALEAFGFDRAEMAAAYDDSDPVEVTTTGENGETFTATFGDGELTSIEDSDSQTARISVADSTLLTSEEEGEVPGNTPATLADVEGAEGAELSSVTLGDLGPFAVEDGNLLSGGVQQFVSTNDDGDAILVNEADATERTSSPLRRLDDALNIVDSLRSQLGAVQNRFEDAITNLNTNETNLAAARSRIEDADYAVEVANMTRAQILQQAGTSVLAQANQIPQIALSLLG